MLLGWLARSMDSNAEKGGGREEDGRVCVRSYGGPLLVLMVAALGFGEARAEMAEEEENGGEGGEWGRIMGVD